MDFTELFRQLGLPSSTQAVPFKNRYDDAPTDRCHYYLLSAKELIKKLK